MSEVTKFRERLKKPIKNVLQLMDIGFSDDDFCKKFAYCYEYLWNDINGKYMSYRNMDNRRVKAGQKKIYFFPKPKRFLCDAAFHHLKRTRKLHESRQVLDYSERAKLEETYRSKSDKKIAERKQKTERNMRYVQNVTPCYSSYLISEYFRLKHEKPKDITPRYIMLLEAARYKCKKTEELLYKVNASERNYHLRYFAFQALQRLGKDVRFRKNRKGKKRPGDTECFTPIDTPEKLLNLIYESQMEENKSYDVFVSHSYRNEDRVLDLKAMLNVDDLNAYIDWVCDHDALRRDMTNKDTAQVLIERLKKSSALLYVYTEECAQSQWAPWELGFFHALDKPIFVLVDTDKKMEMPPYLDLHQKVKIKDGVVMGETEKASLSELIKRTLNNKFKNKKNQ